MSKLLITLLIVIFCLNVNAQTDVGLGLDYGTEISSIGIQARGLKNISETIDGTVHFTYFLPKTEGISGFEVKTSLFTLNFDGHYLAKVTETTKLYPLAGINISIFTVKFENNDFLGLLGGSTSVSSTRLGLNIGGGGSIEFGDGLHGFGELKYVLNEFDQVVISVGVMKTI